MDLGKITQETAIIFRKGLSINFSQTITKDFFNSLIFCITFAILILGFPNKFNGFVNYIFNTIYPQYSAMDLSHQFYFEHLIWAQAKISIFISIPIFLLTLAWSTIFYTAKKEALFSYNAIHLFLFIYRWVIAIQFAGIALTPFLAIKILDINQIMLTGSNINQIPFRVMKKEMICFKLRTIVSFKKNYALFF